MRENRPYGLEGGARSNSSFLPLFLAQAMGLGLRVQWISKAESLEQCAWDAACTRRVKVPFWWSFPPATESNRDRVT